MEFAERRCMTKDTKHIGGSGPNNDDRIETYLDEVRQEEELPWHARRTGHRKSRSKASQRNSLHWSTRSTLGDEITGDSDLE